jgi:hypothetical protein
LVPLLEPKVFDGRLRHAAPLRRGPRRTAARAAVVAGRRDAWRGGVCPACARACMCMCMWPYGQVDRCCCSTLLLLLCAGSSRAHTRAGEGQAELATEAAQLQCEVNAALERVGRMLARTGSGTAFADMARLQNTAADWCAPAAPPITCGMFIASSGF